MVTESVVGLYPLLTTGEAGRHRVGTPVAEDGGDAPPVTREAALPEVLEGVEVVDLGVKGVAIPLARLALPGT